jgi:hypothetical protein
MRPRDTGLPHPADGCPHCIGDFAVVPFRVAETDSEGVRCWYRCPRCRWSWWTSWGTRGMAGNLHYHPDDHDGTACPCGCGLRLLRPARSLGDVA